MYRCICICLSIHDFPPHTHTHPGINTLAYVLCCLPAAVSQLAKEQAIIEFAQPINFYYLNLLLGIYQFVLLLVLSPLTYRLQVGREGGREGGRGDGTSQKISFGLASSRLCGPRAWPFPPYFQTPPTVCKLGG